MLLSKRFISSCIALMIVNRIYAFSTRATSPDARRLANYLKQRKNVVVITGAGLSTESGIPDYRGVNGSYKRGHKPMVHDEFLTSPLQRSRYWARSMIGYENFANAAPNAGHHALAKMEEMGKVNFLITQNVDGLHQKSGSQQVVDLHGRNDRIICLNCGHRSSRMDFQQKLRRINEDWIERFVPKDELEVFADGDVDLKIDFAQFQVPSCTNCGHGILKPEVIFFGDVVPLPRVDQCYAAVNAADGMLVAGTSLMVYSSWRFVDHAYKKGIPIAIINVGYTRADRHKVPHLKIEASTGEVLSGAVGCMLKEEGREKKMMTV